MKVCFYRPLSLAAVLEALGGSALVLLVSPELVTSVNNAVCCVLELLLAFNLLSA